MAHCLGVNDHRSPNFGQSLRIGQLKYQNEWPLVSDQLALKIGMEIKLFLSSMTAECVRYALAKQRYDVLDCSMPLQNGNLHTTMCSCDQEATLIT